MKNLNSNFNPNLNLNLDPTPVSIKKEITENGIRIICGCSSPSLMMQTIRYIGNDTVENLCTRLQKSKKEILLEIENKIKSEWCKIYQAATDKEQELLE